MPSPNFTLLYVKNPTESAAFYQGILGKPPVEAAPTFAMFALESGTMLGLWAASGVQPAATPVGGHELAFAVESKDALAALYRDWQQRGLQVLQPPTDMDFGHTFCAADPDGHRLRVFVPG